MPRGKTAKSLALIDECHDILSVIHPATVRAVCYQLFIRGLIESMEVRCTKRVSEQLVDAREMGLVPWAWIVDEGGAPERPFSAWRDSDEYLGAVMRSYRRDRWAQQPARVEVWSEKGTVRGTLAPVLEAYGVLFRIMGGWGSATRVHDVAEETQQDTQPLIVFYVGDWDPSGLRMSEEDLPERLEKYGGTLTFQRVALAAADGITGALPSFPAATKKSDSRYQWFVTHYGDTCWELDAMSPEVLRERVAQHIAAMIDREAWERCAVTERAEQQSMGDFFRTWKSITGHVPK